MIDEPTRTILRPFADNATVFEAVKNVILSHFEVEVNALMTNEQIGEMTRASLTGKDNIHKAFKELATCKTPPNVVQTPLVR